MNYTIKAIIVIAAVLAVVAVISLTVVTVLAAAAAASSEVEEQYSDILNAYSRELGLNNTLTLQEWEDGSISLMLGDEKMAGFTNAGALNFTKNNLTTVLDQIKTWNAMLTSQ